MRNTTFNWVIIIIVVLGTIDAVVRNVNNLIQGFTGWWDGVAPIVQLLLVILVFYLISKKKN